MNNLFELLDGNFFDKYMHEIISDRTTERIASDIMDVLIELDVQISRNDLIIETVEFGINVNISEKLNERLILLEKYRPECFI